MNDQIRLQSFTMNTVRELVPNGTMMTDMMHDGKRVVHKQITFNQLKSMRAGFGGKIGILPYFKMKDMIYYALAHIFWRKGEESGFVYGDIGGGVKVRETPYGGLLAKLEQKVPLWMDHLIEKMGAETTFIYMGDSYYPDSLQQTRSEMRYEIMIFMEIDVSLLMTFKPTHDIRNLILVREDYMSVVIYYMKINYGLQMFKRYNPLTEPIRIKNNYTDVAAVPKQLLPMSSRELLWFPTLKACA